MSSDNTAEFTHPGPILRAARDELRLSIEHVAERLHLRPSVVALIESETYDDFSSDVFLKGYFRSYCRLVGLHEERMVELLERQLAAMQEETLLKQKADREAQAAEKRMHMFKLTLVVSGILLVCAAVIWLVVGSSGLGFDSAETGRKTVANIELAENESTPLEATNPSLNVDDQVAAEQVQGDDSVDLALASSDDDDGGAADSDDREAIDLQEKPPAAELVGDEAAANPGVPATQIEVTGAEVALSIVFTGECWFEAYDSQGQRISASLKQDGGRFDYEGPKPLRLVLGNGNVASVQVDGQAFDIGSFIRRSGRAELVIE